MGTIVPMPARAYGNNAVNCRLPDTSELLATGGDARIALDSASGLNRYGCGVWPDEAVAAFGSSTASSISDAGFAAADRLRNKLVAALRRDSMAEIHARETARIRGELAMLCGIDDLPGAEVVLAASGTDIHRVVSAFAQKASLKPLRIVMAEAIETGSLVPAAMAGRGCARAEIAALSLRHEDGSPRPLAAIDAEAEELVEAAVAAGQHVLLILTDVSKTGMLAPSPACVAALQRRHSAVNVLVDACQFRIAPATVRAYLERGFMLALTGSKFVGGPSFSGALLIPPALAGCFDEARRISAFEHEDNVGLLLRWEGALTELRRFRALPEDGVAKFLGVFADSIQRRLAQDASFEPLPVPGLDRRPWGGGESWDHVQTIFPFLLCRPVQGGRVPLSGAQTLQVYRLLQNDLSYIDPGDRALALSCQFGQPVACGSRDGVDISALRLCASARVAVEALQGNAAAVIRRAQLALDKAALLAAMAG